MNLKGIIENGEKYKNLLFELVVRDIKIRYRRSVLGLLWTIVHPVLMMIVMTIVFSTTNGLYSVLDGSSLIKKVYIPKYMFPLSKVMSGIVNMFFSFIAMLIIMVITKVSFKETMWLTPIAVFYIALFSTGISLILSTLMVFFRDIAQLYSVITLAWNYLTPIFYPVSLLSDRMPWILKINPMYHYILFFRNIVLYGNVPTISENITCFLIGFITLLIGLMLFYKKQDRFILYI